MENKDTVSAAPQGDESAPRTFTAVRDSYVSPTVSAVSGEGGFTPEQWDAIRVLEGKTVAQQGGGELPQDERLPTLVEYGALRQYLHNDSTDANEEYVFAYDKEVTDRYIAALAQRAASVPAQAGQEPFMYGIMGPSGKAHMDENCVSDDIGTVEYEVENLNEAQDGGYTVVPLYLAAPVPAASVHPDCGACPGDGTVCSKSCKVADESPQPDIGRDAALVKAIDGLMDFSPTNAGPLPGMVRGGEYVRKADVLAALATRPAPEVASVQPVAVPEGWVLVPIEPTEAMLADVDEDVGGHCHSCSVWKASWDDCRRVYAAMLAAPSAPAVQVQPVGYVFGNSYWEEGNPRLTDEMRRLGQPRFAAAPAQPAAPAVQLVDFLIQHKHCMSYNDSYFTEPAGQLKRMVYAADRHQPAAPNPKPEPSPSANERLVVRPGKDNSFCLMTESGRAVAVYMTEPDANHVAALWNGSVQGAVDAARYRWLRTDRPEAYVAVKVADGVVEALSGDELDAAIDDARAA